MYYKRAPSIKRYRTVFIYAIKTTHIFIDIVNEHKQSALHSLSFRHGLHLHGVYDVLY